MKLKLIANIMTSEGVDSAEYGDHEWELIRDLACVWRANPEVRWIQVWLTPAPRDKMGKTFKDEVLLYEWENRP